MYTFLGPITKSPNDSIGSADELTKEKLFLIVLIAELLDGNSTRPAILHHDGLVLGLRDVRQIILRDLLIQIQKHALAFPFADFGVVDTVDVSARAPR